MEMEFQKPSIENQDSTQAEEPTTVVAKTVQDHLEILGVVPKRKSLEDRVQGAEDDGYVRPDKCELCGISFLGNQSQWNRYNIKVHINSKTCQNNQKKNLKNSGVEESGADVTTKTPRAAKGNRRAKKKN